MAEDAFLDPASDPARLRAFFVGPVCARRGLARSLFERCPATATGFCELELMGALRGEPLYAALGFVVIERAVAELPDGRRRPLARTSRPQ